MHKKFLDPPIAIRLDDRPIILFNESGFTHTRHLELNVSQSSKPDLDLSKACFLLSLVYITVAVVWIHTLYKKARKGLRICRIHCLMQAAVTLKAFNLVREAEYKSHIKQTGRAHNWDAEFCMCNIVLIAAGWLLLKPYLQDKAKKVLTIAVPLQVYANIVQNGNGSSFEQDWKQVFLLVDVVCSCAVLFFIVRLVENVRVAVKSDSKEVLKLIKVSLFRKYYIALICYIYSTRVAVYALETITCYKYLWSSVVVWELATLAFYEYTRSMLNTFWNFVFLDVYCSRHR
ncbi:hypothetical protein V6N13_064514 [Hibiscus sabdariffa]|uniref:GOST seven transmembrane domain-containing protein n=1 Tax=Hibiscus sabdariffa TaxID=183260 RepID=A0ABR2EC27_9ROSI